MKSPRLKAAHQILLSKSIDQYLPYLNAIFKHYNMNLNIESSSSDIEFVDNKYNMVLASGNTQQKREGYLDNKNNQIVFCFDNGYRITLTIALDETNAFSVTVAQPNRYQIKIHVVMNQSNNDIESITCDVRPPFKIGEDYDPSIHSDFSFGNNISIGAAEAPENYKLYYNPTDDKIYFQESSNCWIGRNASGQYELQYGDESRSIAQTTAFEYALQFINDSTGIITDELIMAESIAPGVQKILLELLEVIKNNHLTFENTLGFSMFFEILSRLQLEKNKA